MNRVISVLALLLLLSPIMFGQTIYKVAAGDTKESIAAKFDIDTEALLRANPNLQSFIFVGMEVIIPESKVSKAPSIVETRQLPADNDAHDGYYFEGTVSDLKKMGLIVGSVFNPMFNENALTEESLQKIDKTVSSIPLNGKQPKMLVAHPANSYSFTVTFGKFTFNILDPDLFWSTSKFVIIQTK